MRPERVTVHHRGAVLTSVGAGKRQNFRAGRNPGDRGEFITSGKQPLGGKLLLVSAPGSGGAVAGGIARQCGMIAGNHFNFANQGRRQIARKRCAFVLRERIERWRGAAVNSLSVRYHRPSRARRIAGPSRWPAIAVLLADNIPPGPPGGQGVARLPPTFALIRHAKSLWGRRLWELHDEGKS
jgi:hypothetical protein